MKKLKFLYSAFIIVIFSCASTPATPPPEEPAVAETALAETALADTALEDPALEELALEEIALTEHALEEFVLEEIALAEIALEESAPEEIALEEFALEEIALEEPVIVDTAPEEIALADTALEESALEEIALTDTALEETALEELTPEEIAITETALEELALAEPVLEEPAIAKTVFAEPVVADTAPEKTALAEPVLTEPVRQPVFIQREPSVASGFSSLNEKPVVLSEEKPSARQSALVEEKQPITGNQRTVQQPVTLSEITPQNEPLQEPEKKVEIYDYLKKAREEFNEGRIEPAISFLDQYREAFPYGNDEAWWLYAQCYEALSPSRNILASLDYYRKLINDFPQSDYTNTARGRISYLTRYYINIK